MERPSSAPVLKKKCRDKKAARASSAILTAKKNAKLKQQQMNNLKTTEFIHDIYKKVRDSKEMNTERQTGIIYHESMIEHFCLWDKNYPECPERFSRIIDRCKELNLLERTVYINPRYATKDELLTKHNVEHIEKLEKTSQCQDIEKLEDISSCYDAIYIHPTTYELSRLSAGCALELIDAVCTGKVQNGMAIIRPPGHHAMSNEFCGYCLFNNVALAAHHAINNHNINRILIVDWDVHHGQATQQMFYDDPKVLYLSLHRFENGTFWPNLKESNFDYIGKDQGSGFNINLPLNSTGMNDIDYLMAWFNILMPIATEFQPELVLVSAGYDAAIGCPEGLMNLTPAVYAHLTHMLLSLANGKVCVFLEGGYCLRSLAEGAALTLRSLLGDPCPKLATLTSPNKSMFETIWDVGTVHYKYWKFLRTWPTTLSRDVNSNCLKSPSVCHKAISVFSGKSVISDKYETRNCYPVPNKEFVDKTNQILDKLINECHLMVPKQRVVYAWHEDMLHHRSIDLDSHPEKPERIISIIEKLNEFNIPERCTKISSRYASSDEILMVHTLPLLKLLSDISQWDNDKIIKKQEEYKSIYFHSKTERSASLAAGTLLAITDEVLSGKSRSGVAIIRPPGHHAEPNDPCGFCIFNNISIAAKYAIEKYNLERILILDWDVHHGNGTQMIFENDPKVLYISIHRYENASFFPNSKKANYTNVGIDAGKGFNVNIPWNKRGMGDSEYMAAFHRIVMPISYAFNPQLVLVSAGFDAAIGDPIGGCNVSPEAFGHMTHMLTSLACGRIILALEGGYNTETIAFCMVSCFKALLGDSLLALASPGLQTEIQQSAINTLRNVAKIQSEFWPILKVLDVKLSLEDDFFLDVLPTTKQQQIVPDAENIIDKLANLDIDLDANKTELEDMLSCCKDKSKVTNKCDHHINSKQYPIHNDNNDDDNDKSKKSMNEPGPSGAASTSSTDNKDKLGLQSLTQFLDDNLKMLVSGQMYAVVPLNDCPHLPCVQKVPETGIDPTQPCGDCGSQQENWICLICYDVFCGRFINQHMIDHSVESGHPLTMSFTDLSVWCYICESYIENMILYEAKNALHFAKFGTTLPWTYGN